jgi:hypothetical protein
MSFEHPCHLLLKVRLTVSLDVLELAVFNRDGRCAWPVGAQAPAVTAQTPALTRRFDDIRKSMEPLAASRGDAPDEYLLRAGDLVGVGSDEELCWPLRRVERLHESWAFAALSVALPTRAAGTRARPRRVAATGAARRGPFRCRSSTRSCCAARGVCCGRCAGETLDRHHAVAGEQLTGDLGHRDVLAVGCLLAERHDEVRVVASGVADPRERTVQVGEEPDGPLPCLRRRGPQVTAKGSERRRPPAVTSHASVSSRKLPPRLAVSKALLAAIRRSSTCGSMSRRSIHRNGRNDTCP